MEISVPTWWWLIAGALVAVELMTGTFYLLMLALGAAAGAIAAHLGWSLPMQVLSAAVIGAATTVVWHFKRARTADVGDRLSNRDLSLDIGEQVQVDQWNPDGSAQVHFRGSTWQARMDEAGLPSAGLHIIVALEGNRLMLRRR
jgi:membrane protein implicated in regulation of membrane protease activity